MSFDFFVSFLIPGTRFRDLINCAMWINPRSADAFSPCSCELGSGRGATSLRISFSFNFFVGFFPVIPVDSLQDLTHYRVFLFWTRESGHTNHGDEWLVVGNVNKTTSGSPNNPAKQLHRSFTKATSTKFLPRTLKCVSEESKKEKKSCQAQ
jgi:hypothetical protein